MKKVEIPACFSTLNKGKVTLYIRNEYENRISENDIEKLFNLCKDFPPKSVDDDSSRFNNSYLGRSHCKTFFMESMGNESFVVREYWHGGLIGKIFRDFFWDSMRPVKELLVCEAANRGGIKTTEIIAIIRNKIMGPLYKCRLVTKEITKSIDLIELLLHSEKNQLFVKQKRQIINKLAKAVKDMHDVGIFHADLHLKNILVQFENGGSINVYIIDLDKSRQFGKISFKRRMKNIMRLDRSLEKFKRNIKGNGKPFLTLHTEQSLDGSNRCFTEMITNIDKVRFLKEYIKLSGNLDQYNFQNQKEFLKDCLTRYQTSHKSHRIWWRIVNGKF